MHTRRKTDDAGLNKPSIKVTLFGEFTCKNQFDEHIIITNKRAKAILALLCLTPNEPIQREVLSQLLWPGRFDAQAKSSLRQCLLYLSNILNALHPELLVVSRSHVAINDVLVQTELLTIEHALYAKDTDIILCNLSKIGAHQLLENTGFSKKLDDLIILKRLNVERLLKTGIEQFLQWLITQDATSDYQRISQAWSIRPTVIDIIGLAVLPFKSIPEESQQQYFADNMSEELNTLLAQVPYLSLAGSTSTFGLRDSGKTLPQIAKLLNVQYVIQGSLQRIDDNIKINVRLVEGNTGLNKWSKQYIGKLDSLFTLQQIVANDVCNEISIMFNIALVTPKINQMTTSQEAYDYYMQGRDLTRRIIGEGVLFTAISLFEKALAIDSQFAKCWSALAEANAYVTAFTPCPNKRPYIDKVAECAQKALSIAPNDGLAMVMLGVYKWTQNDPLAALDLAYLAYHHEPHNPSVSARLGSFLCYCGKTETALPYIAKSAEQDPLNGRHLALLSNVLLNMGNLEGARNVASKMSAVGFPSLFLGLTTALAGENELAVKLYSQTRLLMNYVMSSASGNRAMTEQEQDKLWDVASKGICSGKKTDRLMYCQLLDHLHMTLPDKQDHSIVMPAVWMGYTPMVFKTLGENITPANMNGFGYLWADIAPLNASVKHPDFLDFACKVGLIKVWEKYGWPEMLMKAQKTSQTATISNQVLDTVKS
jgi:TolB-like protein